MLQPSTRADASTRTFSEAGTSSDASRPGWATSDPEALAEVATLARGTILASRFRIDRLLGRGGAGEVYEARDLELDVSVALKTLRPERMTRPDAIASIKRELATARRITHPGVARVFDFAVHGKGGQLGFLTMELLVGESLFDTLQREGAWPERKVVALGVELCQALAAVHDAGIVHRDFKSANVLLAEIDGGGHRAVVTDLGLATTLARGVAPGTRCGTPAYMAPEQVRGEPVDPRTDLFALGVVLFELLTGRRPFEGTTLEATMDARLTSRAPRVRALRPQLSTAIDRLVEGLLQREPIARPNSAREVAAALGRIKHVPGTPKRFVVAATLVAALAAGAVAVAEQRAGLSAIAAPRPSPPAEAAPSRVRPVVALLPSTGAAESLVGEALARVLAASKDVRFLNVTTSAGAASDLDLPPGVPSASVDRNRLATLLGADAIVHVASLDETGALRITLAEQREDAGTATHDVSGVTDPSDAAERVIDRVFRHLGVRPPEAAAAIVRTVIPSEPSTRLSLDSLLRGCSSVAATNNDDHLWSVVKLAECAERRGDTRTAHKAAEEALGRSQELPLALRLHVEMTLRRVLGQWVDVAAATRPSLDENPDDGELRLLLAEALTRTGDGTRAVEALRSMPEPYRDTPRALLATAAAYQVSYDNENVRENARRAYRAAAALGARRSMAQARLADATAAKYQGRFGEALEAVREAKKTFTALSAPREVVLALDAEGDTLLRMASYDESERVNREMLERARAMGEPAFVGLALHDAARIRHARQDFVGARALEESALATFERAGDVTHEMWALQLLADVDAQLGAYDSSLRRYERALRLARDLGAREDEAIGHHNLGERLHARFELKRAEQEFDHALELSEPIQSALGLTHSRMWKARAVLGRGDPRAAAPAARAALDAALRTGNRTVEGSAHLLLAEIAFASGDRGEAEAAARRSIDVLDTIGEPLGAAEARLVLSEVLSWYGDSAKDARALSEAALEIARSVRTPRVLARAYAATALAIGRSDVVLARSRARSALDTAATLEGGDRARVTMFAARALLASGDPSSADVAARTLTASARAGALELELEAKLVVVQGRRPATADRDLAAIERAADAAGLVRVARAAMAARAR